MSNSVIVLEYDGIPVRFTDEGWFNATHVAAQFDKEPFDWLRQAETVALWHAVNWMEVVLREWKRDGFKDEQDQAQHEVQRQHLTDAKRALRKVNALRKAQQNKGTELWIRPS